MRDIKAPRSDQPEADQPETPEIKPVPKRLPGSTVPVARIEPKQPVQPPVVPPPSPQATEPFARTPLKRKEIQRVQRQMETQRFQVGHRERLIVAVLLVLTAFVGGLAALIFLPSARVELLLRTAPLLVEETLTITAEAGDDATTIPGSVFFREVRIEGAVPVQGKETIGEKARGTVLIINRTSQEQKIVGSSRLVTADGQLFLTQSAVTVPPAESGLSSAPVAVEAAVAGPEGNLKAGTRLNFAALDSSAQSVVYAEARQGLEGGSGEEVQIVTAEDTIAAREAAEKQARERVEGDIRAELEEGWVLMDESWGIELTNFEVQAEEGQRVTELPFTAQAAINVMGYEQTRLEEKLRTALESRLDKEYVLFPGAISYTKAVKNVDWEQGRAEVAVRVTHTTMPDLSLETLRTKLAGRSRAEAQQYLEGLPGVRSATIELSPFWVRSAPRVERRITITLTPERQP